MDIRHAIEGGGLPKAPPGKRIESPPPKEEFEKKLQEAKKEETTPGEVAENEPNAQLQKLDSEEKKEETSVSNPAVIAIPILVEQVAAIQVQVNALALTPTSTNSNDSRICNDFPTNGTGGICNDFPTQGGELALQGEVDAAKKTTGGSQELLQLISAMQGRKGTATAKNIDPQATGTENTISQEIKNGLNITSVQSKNGNVLAGQAEAAKPVEKAIEPTAKNETVKTEEVSVKGVSVDVSGGQLQGDAGKDELSDSDHKSSETAIMELQGQKPIHGGKIEGKDENLTRALTNDDRQRVVETLTKKIEELSVRSVRNEVRVEMHPPEMGSVVVNLRNSLEGLTATLSASNEPLRQALHESRNDLAGALADRNVGQVRIEVRSANPDTMNMGQQFNQSQSQNPQHSQYHAPKHAVVDNRSFNQNSSPTVEDKPVVRRSATTLIDMEI